MIALPDAGAFDLVALGEVMLRLDPGEGRVRTARSFHVSEGGGEYNVARGLRRAFGLRAAVVTALVDNEVGRLVEDLVLTGGVDPRFVRWVPFDGTGRDSRNGLNFTERGFGVRGAVGVSDRGHTAVSQLRPGDVDWDGIFAGHGARWFHTGGIFAALGEATADVAFEAVTAARAHGTVVSYDLNYRPSLWQSIGGLDRAQEVNRAILPHVDVLVGVPAEPTPEAIARTVEEFPNLQVVATTTRTVHSASVNDWGAIAWSADEGLVRATQRDGLEVLDRMGGGDSFASGLIYGLLAGHDLGTAVEYGAAHGALAMTTPGDTSMVTLADVQRLVGGGGAHVDR